MYKVFKVSGSGTLEQRILGLFEIKAENMYIHFQNAGWILINQQNFYNFPKIEYALFTL